MNQPFASQHLPFNDLARQLIADFAAARPMHANSLLITVYGDTVCPYGGTIWLGSLIKLVEPLGISERLVRTSVYRLTEKQILTSHQLGRRSYYTLTERGLRQFASAARRIYAPTPPSWHGGWQLVMTALGELDTEQRETVHKELIWLGFSRLAAGFYLHPIADGQAVSRMLEERHLSEQVILLQARSAGDNAELADRLLSERLYQQQQDDAYHEFVKYFQPVLQAAREAVWAPDPKLCFLVRTLLIHRFRHILLHDVELPVQLLPVDAKSQQARAITRELYLCLSGAADKYFLDVAESKEGKFGDATDDYYQRFVAG